MSEAALRRGKITPEDRAAYPPYPPNWYIQDEEQVPESRPHDLEGEHLRQLLLGWQMRFQQRLAIGRNIAVRPDQTHPGMGVDPDVYVLENPPPGFDFETSLRLWESGTSPLLLAIEIVSESRPQKDYEGSPIKYSLNGTRELWVFDPKMCGKGTTGKPIRLQIWRRDDDTNFNCVYAGEGPVYSETIHAWVFVTNEGQRVNIADDAEGTQWWMTPEELQREAKLQERKAKEEAFRQREEALKQSEAALKQSQEALRQREEERKAKEEERKAKEEERKAKEEALALLDQERSEKEQMAARLAALEALLAKQA